MAHLTGWFRSRLEARLAQDPEEGAWVAPACCLLLFFVVMVMTGYAVDGSAQTRAVLYAQTVAGQSARHGAQQIQPGPVTGQAVALDPDQAAAEAQAFLSEHDADLYSVTGACHAQEDTVVCDTMVSYDTIFLGIITIDTLTVHGHAEAEGTRTLDGVPR